MSAYHEELVQDHPEAISPDLRASLRAGMFIPAVKYLQAQRVRRRFRAQMEALASKYDILLTPTTPSPAPRDLTTTGDPVFQNMWTNLGFPTITLPCGLSRSGLPLGVQLIGPPFSDSALFSVGSWCEGVLQVRLSPPLVGANPDNAPRR
jgi:aspartyl-tRNA(Asn)/glutamyl-tRNA(Gln) amidotransferase subunit A